MNKKYWSLLTLIIITAMILSACATATTEAPADTGAPAATSAPTGGGEVYYLNFKPEVAEIYTAIAEAYKAETGVTLKVVTAAAGTYEQTLKSEIAKSDPPVLFQINGPRGLRELERLLCRSKETPSCINILPINPWLLPRVMAYMVSLMWSKGTVSFTTMPS